MTDSEQGVKVQEPAFLSSNNARLVVIVVNWNGGSKLTRCLDSLMTGLRDVDFAGVVVDNASEDGSVDTVQDRYPWLRLLRNSANLGFSRGNNLALKFLHDQGWQGDYVLFLNNDTELETPGFSILLDFMDRHPDVAALTPVLIESDGRYQIGVGGRRFTWFQIFAHFFFLNRLPFLGHLGVNLNQARFADSNRPVNLDWISGTAMLVRYNLMGMGDFFPVEYFMYFEDVAASEKLRQQGRLVYHPCYRVRHHRRPGERNLEYYFQSLQYYLHSQGFSAKKMRITRITILLGLAVRNLAFALPALVSSRFRRPRSIVRRQMAAIKRQWLTGPYD